MSENSEDEDISIEPPPLYLTIREILQEYPDGQIFKEIIQNADDARATEVKFFLDYRHIQSVAPSLASSCPDLHLFEGPALLAYNNAGFKKNDWKSILRPKRSEKANDCMKVGKFGSGFNSVYHITDLPIIVSGERYVVMDPLEIIKPRKNAHSQKLSDLSRDPTALSGFSGICSDCHNFANKTLFRFPLRKQRSKLSDVNYTPEKLWNTLEALRKEANYLLLFLRSVQTIGVYKITHSGKEMVFSVSIAKKDWQRRHENLRKFEDEIKYHFLGKQLRHEVRELVSQFRVVVAEQDMTEREYEWLVVQQVGSASEVVLDMVRLFNDRGESVLPWVGTAIELAECQQLESGRIFCFLPMPFEKLSPLPVHVNGTFAVSKDRRSLKWPTIDRQADPGAQWNELLTKFCLSSCYKQLIVSLTERKPVLLSTTYKAWPDPSVVCRSEWNGLLGPLFSTLFQERMLYSKARGGQWVTLDEALLTPESIQISEIVSNCLLKSDLKLVNATSLILEVINFCTDVLKLSLPYKCISPDIVTETLKCNPACYKSLSYHQKLDLLSYCINVSEYSALQGIELLPLANGKFVRFQEGSFADKVYLSTCSTKFPSFLLPSFGSCLVKVDDKLQSCFEKLAASDCTQVCEMTLDTVATLLPQSIKKGWSVDQYRSFWNWVQHHDLSYFTECPIIPIADGSHIVPVNLSADEVVLITEFNKHMLMPSLLDAFKKIGIKIARQDQYCFLKHDNILNYVSHFTPEGILSIASFSGQTTFTFTEGKALQTFLATSDITTSRSIESLCKMRIFYILQQENRLFSINEVANRRFYGALAEDSNCPFKISRKFLPLQPLVLAQRNNNTTLWNNVCLITMYDYICEHAFPLIREKSFSGDRRKGFMVEVLQLLLSLRESDDNRKKVVEEMSTVPFLLDHKNTLKCPTELFDSNCDRVMSLYKGEPVFPMHPFNLKKYSRLLRQAGLKSQEDVTANDILEIVNQIKCNGNLPETVGRNRYDRACAVVKHLSEKPLLLDKTTAASIFDFTLLDDLTCLDQTSWLPVCSTSPADYPRCLSWKGSSYPNCLASQAVGIVPLTHELSLITGSQLFFLQDAAENELTLKLRPSQDVLLQAVAKHFIEVVNCKNIDRYSRGKIVNLTYTYLRDNDGRDIVRYLPNERCIWLENRQVLVESSNVALHSNNKFSSNLEPFITVLSDKYERQFHDFFETLGVPKEINIQQILSVLKMIKERTVAKVSYTQAWQMVIDILYWVADNSDEIDFEEVLVPVQSTNCYPVLMPINEVAYIDSDLLMAFQQQPCSVIHEKISSGLYKKLRVRPLSEYLGISAELPQDVGQQEPLLQRLKNILKDYQDGLTIVKELLQNADDAGATELNIIYDSRNHKSKELLFPGMAKAHGPALIVHNDQKFNKEDFENITKLAGATKRDKPLKIGKFGVGFCSVYHITDVPSLVSGEWLYIFDPTLHHLPIKNLAQPGKMIHCTFPLLKRSQQMDPYESIHSYTPGHPYSGTIFRLPFRTCSSELSTKCYMESDIVSLKNQLEKEGTKLLLFLQHVKKITFSEWKQHYRVPQQLFQIHRTCGRISECVQQVKLQINTVSTPESWLVSSYLNEHGSSYQSAAVASRLMPIDQGYKSSQVCGECFCSLPLGSQTSLPVHVSANFAVNINRRDLDDSEKGVKWNRDLMQSAITRAYLQLLIALKDLALDEHDTKCVSLHEYTFHSLWPIKEHLEHVNPWNILIKELYKEISTHDLFYSHPKLKWQRLSDCKFICTKIFEKLSFEPTKCVAQGLEILCEPTVDLPEKFHHCFPNMTFIYENEFIDTFLNNISSFSSYTDTCTRDKIIVLILELYSRQSDKKKSDFDSDLNLDFNLASTAFIPCTPNENLKLCKDLADPTSSIAQLFTPSDGYFPIKMLCDSQPAMRAMRILGLQMETVSYEALADCARQIPSLYYREREKALKNLVLIMKCVEKHLELDFCASFTKCKILNNIPFLPVMQKPENYVLPWYAETMLFQSPCNLMYGPKLPDLVGSQVAIVDAEVERKSPSDVLSHIGMKTEAELSTVITQLRCLLEIDLTTVDSDAIGRTYTTICDFLQKTEEILDLDELKTLPCVWTGQLFVKPDCVAKNWKCDGPILHPVPKALISKTSLQKSLGCKDSFSIVDLLSALSLLYQADCSEPLNKQSQELVRDIVAELDKFNEDLFENCNENDTLALPDTSFVMCKVSDLVFNDVEWDSDNNRIVHGCVTISLAKKLRVVFIRNKVLESSELRKFPGVPFGQKETLQRRISNILEQYPFDETFIKEILQNADDAKATKLCIILDKRQLVSKKNKMISDSWKELQGPALLLWNNSTFTDKDLQGIQDLGTGGKRGDSDTIGQFGIGFSVVYHVTDCPSIVTSVDGVSSLCVFDPLCKYVPGADVSNPGRRYEIKESFWKKFPAIKQGYNIDKLDGCPDSMKEDLWKGSLFRLPLRKNDSENPESYYCSIQTEFKPDVTTEYLFGRIKQWIEDVKLSLLFLNHVTDIEFYMIDEGQKMILLASHSTELTEDAKRCRNDLEGALASFDNDNMSLLSEPKVFLYQIKIASIVWSFRDESQKAKPPKVKKESWLVQEGVGDIFLSDRKWPAHNFKPRHGLAAALQPGQFKRGQVFCFLPLPSSSSFKLPVHINGQFMLENTRKNLWTPSNPNISDNRSSWNTYLLEAISSSYAQFLQDAIPFFVNEFYESYEVANNNLTEYYNIFPTHSKAQIKDKVLKTLSQKNARILCSVKEQSETSSSHQYVTEWAPIKDENPLYQSYMFPAFQPPIVEYILEENVSEEDQQKRKEELEEEVKKLKESHDRLRFLIARIGMNINSVPNCICRALNIPEANGREVLSFCKSFPEKIGALPCPIEETSIYSVENFAALLEYVCSDYGPHLQFIDSDHVGAPFLLTADRHLQLFTEDHRVIYCEQLDVFVHSSVIKHFAHPKMIEMNIESTYFYQANEKRFYFVSQILLNTFPRALLRNNFEGPCTNSCVLPKETLKRIWKCLTKTQVFRYHLTTILKQWALIPSEQNHLFLYSDQDVLPVDMCKTYLTDNLLKLTEQSQSPDLLTEDDDVYLHFDDDETEKNQLQLQLHVSEILEQLGIPVLDITVVSSECLCDIPSILRPESVLKNLKHWNKSHQIQLKDDETRCAIFQYFSVLNFGNKYRKNLYREYIQSLQLFKNVDERLTCLSGKKVFVWPCNIELAGLSEWLPDDCVFLEEDGKWKYLGIDQEAIIERKIDSLAVYAYYILLNFDKLDEADRYKHLEHIKDRLLPLFRSDNQPIKQLFAHSACIENELGELKFVSELCDSSVNLFRMFHDHFPFPHYKYQNEEWLPFLREMGLQQEVTMEKYEELCKLVQSGQHENLQQSSEVLLEYLLLTLRNFDERFKVDSSAEDWSCAQNRDFLERIFEISFVIAEHLPHLNWIVKQCAVSNCIPCEDTTYHLTKLNGAAISDVADTVWTVKPVVKLPEKYHSDKADLLSDMGLIIKPSLSIVLENVHNIVSCSKFGSINSFDKFSVDFELSEQHNLLRVMLKNFERLKTDETEELEQIHESLASLECVPIFAGNSTQPHWFILVEPLCVIANSSVKDYQPFLNPLPEDLMNFMPNVLSHIGVKHELGFDHCCYALKKIYQCSSENEVDVNTRTILEKLLEQMYSIMLDQKGIDNCNDIPLYLPSIHFKLMPSNCLVYCDEMRYRTFEYNVSEDSCVSVLLLPNFDGARVTQFCELLPEKIRPKRFSYCKHVLFSQNETETNDVTENLERALQIHRSIHVLESILINHQVPQDQCKLLLQYFQDVLYCAKVVSIANLKIKLFAQNPDLPEADDQELATCKVDYFIQEERDTKKSIIYIDASVSNKSVTVKVYFPIAKHMMNIASIGHLQHLPHVIFLLLQLQSEEEIDNLFEDSSIPLSSATVAITPKLGALVPMCLHHKLDQDVKNIFRPGEWVGFATSKDHEFIFAQIYCPNNDIKSDNIYDNEYYVVVSDDDNDEQLCVSIIKLYKFMRSSQVQQSQIDDTTNEQRASSSIQHNCDEIIEALDSVDEEHQQLNVRRLLLKWNPKSNQKQTALVVYTFLIEELKRRGLYVTEIEECDSIASTHQIHAEQNPGPVYEHFEVSYPPDIPRAQCWLEQAMVDKKVLDVVLIAANEANEMCGHVCFLAHEVAEKALKAGMYAIHGKHTDAYLGGHQIKPLYENITHKLLEDSSRKMRDYIHTLMQGKYYLKTRFPNQWYNGSLPADQFTLEQAQEAQEIADYIIQTVTALIP